MPEYKSFRVFGCLCYPFIRPYNSHKLQYRSLQCVFLGYSFQNKRYCLDPLTGRVYVTPHVVFDETKFLFPTPSLTSDSSAGILTPAILSFPDFSPTHTSHSPSQSVLPLLNDSAHSISASTPTPVSHFESTSIPEDQDTCSTLALRMTTRLMHGITKKKTIFDLSATKISEPHTLSQALKDSNWTQAMDLEIAALHKNHTWDLVDQPAVVNIIGCKWVYKLKHKPNGSIDRYKARLVAKGYHQTLGLDYFETFSLVVKTATIRIILTIAINFQWEIRQLDVHNAFLNGELEEQVYMAQPPGYKDPQFPTKVCRLKKALYGLKQAPRAWFQRLSSTLLQWGFNNSRTNSSMFLHFGASTTLIVLIYVDDILITGSSSQQISSLITRLDSVFALQDLG